MSTASTSGRDDTGAAASTSGGGGGNGGGANFERLVKQNAWLFPQPEMDAETEALDAFWLSKGVTEEHQRKSLSPWVENWRAGWRRGSCIDNPTRSDTR